MCWRSGQPTVDCGLEGRKTEDGRPEWADNASLVAAKPGGLTTTPLQLCRS